MTDISTGSEAFSLSICLEGEHGRLFTWFKPRILARLTPFSPLEDGAGNKVKDPGVEYPAPFNCVSVSEAGLTHPGISCLKPNVGRNRENQAVK